MRRDQLIPPRKRADLLHRFRQEVANATAIRKSPYSRSISHTFGREYRESCAPHERIRCENPRDANAARVQLV
jgi:hypothetical protein